MNIHKITAEQILPLDVYGQQRDALRMAILPVKARRRIAIGPDCTAYFENAETMLHQVHEMLWIEKGGEGQLADELAAYNPLIPQGRELVATVMFEIDDPVRRKAVLGKLGGVEHNIFIEIDGKRVATRPEVDVDRTTTEGKASSIHFVHFDFSPEQIMAFRQPSARVVIGVDHADYGHMAVMPEAMRQELGRDFG